MRVDGAFGAIGRAGGVDQERGVLGARLGERAGAVDHVEVAGEQRRPVEVFDVQVPVGDERHRLRVLCEELGFFTRELG